VWGVTLHSSEGRLHGLGVRAAFTPGVAAGKGPLGESISDAVAYPDVTLGFANRLAAGCSPCCISKSRRLSSSARHWASRLDQIGRGGQSRLLRTAASFLTRPRTSRSRSRVLSPLAHRRLSFAKALRHRSTCSAATSPVIVAIRSPQPQAFRQD
jgi:hypothetical protein